MTDQTIEPIDGQYWLVEHGEYEQSSVLAGQARRQLIRPYDTSEEAQTENPGAELLEHSTKVHTEMSQLPPSWFDPSDAGECWHEDDY